MSRENFQYPKLTKCTEAEAMSAMQTSLLINSFHSNSALIPSYIHSGFEPLKELYYGTPIGYNLSTEVTPSTKESKDEKTQNLLE